MRNQHQDSKISLTLSKISASSNSLLLLGFFLSLLLIPQFSFAEVFVPTDEYIGYFDSNGIYTVVGNVKNDLNYDIIPTVSISVKDDSEIFSKTIQHVPLSSSTEIPFKIKFPEVLGNSPILMPAEISFEKTKTNVITIDVIYSLPAIYGLLSLTYFYIFLFIGIPIQIFLIYKLFGKQDKESLRKHPLIFLGSMMFLAFVLVIDKITIWGAIITLTFIVGWVYVFSLFGVCFSRN